MIISVKTNGRYPWNNLPHAAVLSASHADSDAISGLLSGQHPISLSR